MGPEDDSVRVETCSPAVTLYVLYLLLLCFTDTFCPLYSVNTSGWKTSNLKLYGFAIQLVVIEIIEQKFLPVPEL